MSEESKDTLVDNRTILEAIKSLSAKVDSLQSEMNQKIDDVNKKIDAVNTRIYNVELTVVEIKNSQFSMDVRLERVEGSVFEHLSIAHNLRADVKVLRAELMAWAKDVTQLEKQLA
jgi:chromosome segregation ATPase